MDEESGGTKQSDMPAQSNCKKPKCDKHCLESYVDDSLNVIILRTAARYGPGEMGGSSASDVGYQSSLHHLHCEHSYAPTDFGRCLSIQRRSFVCDPSQKIQFRSILICHQKVFVDQGLES